MQVNLLNEIEEIFQRHRVSWKLVRFIANAEGTVEIAQFVTLAKMYYYDNTTSDISVDPTLVIVGSTWWLSRTVIDGIEQWQYHKKPQRPTLQSPDFKIKVYRSSFYKGE